MAHNGFKMESQNLHLKTAVSVEVARHVMTCGDSLRDLAQSAVISWLTD
ncbi:hypothetical protein MSP8887_00339 [Marinomonas spartinae]|uniref:Uncharacterized protein n=1 Tax=Marinomonas spartinae TaxID=1792290 RepID=A0A1A8TJU3_9GAMM|nr:hypothetical protein [Marinomonas spartinae]SBS26122.1 hypothetical protein MSP8887_00339 [Marinomonas spartinae]SBS32548.1 hypothetical protein MSP8886_02464 [Marinomonas spartinae]